VGSSLSLTLADQGSWCQDGVRKGAQVNYTLDEEPGGDAPWDLEPGPRTGEPEPNFANSRCKKAPSPVTSDLPPPDQNGGPMSRALLRRT
jgi:hypothetical protein